MSYFGWSGMGLTHGTMGGTGDKHWSEDEKFVKELNEKMGKNQEMNLCDAIVVLENHNKWRQGDDSIAATNPKELTRALDAAINLLKGLNKNCPPQAQERNRTILTPALIRGRVLMGARDDLATK